MVESSRRGDSKIACVSSFPLAALSNSDTAMNGRRWQTAPMRQNRISPPFSHCLLLVLFSVTAFAQGPTTEVILPGDARVDGSIIRAATNAWKMTGTSPGGRRTDGGVWRDKIELVERSGLTIIRRTQLDSGPEGTTTFITETDQKKLTPILAEVTTPGGLHRVWKFESDHVHSVVNAPSKPGEAARTRESDIAISQPVFDFDGGMFGLLVAGFPLQENFSAKFPVFDPRNGVAWATYTVIGRERVPAGKKRPIEAWTVEVRDPVRLARMIFSLTKEPPCVIRLQEAGEGMFWVFDMI